MADSTQSQDLATAASLPYHEPSITQILILASFCLSLNVINYALDRLLYCGLIGQLFIGIAWGAPGGNWLSASLQDAIVQIGYLGLILIVFEGIFCHDIRYIPVETRGSRFILQAACPALSRP